MVTLLVIWEGGGVGEPMVDLSTCIVNHCIGATQGSPTFSSRMVQMQLLHAPTHHVTHSKYQMFSPCSFV
jgi:hypothetical protein